MKNAGPNEPCPCGSGKKFKRCCALKQISVANPDHERARRQHERDQELSDEMLGFATKRFGRELMTKLVDEFPGDLEAQPELLGLFIPWALYGEQVEGKPIARWFLDERRRPLDADALRWVEAQLSSHLSLWLVEAVERGQALELRDLLTGERRRITERMASQDAEANLVLLARVVDFDGLSLLAGLHCQPLGPAAASEVIDAWRTGAKVRKKLVPAEKLREPDLALGLMDLWDAYVTDMRSHGMPTLQNTDGEELLFTRDLYRVPRGRRAAVLEKLSAIEGAQPQPAEDGQTEVVFVRAGKAQRKAAGDTVVGRAVLEGDSLRLESNSLERADRLRAQVEQACAGLVEHRIRDHQDPAAALSRQPRAAGPEAPRAPEPQEMLAALQEVKRQHYASWLDEPVPALKGKTPREAARTPKGRERLDLLLREMEMLEARLPEAERFEIATLRSELGL